MEQRELLDLALEAVDGNQAELARRLGRSETTISRWVTGRNGIDFESALRLARLTGLPARDVVETCGLDGVLVPASTDKSSDPDLAAVEANWPSLDPGIQRAIRILAGAIQAPVTGHKQPRFNGPSRPVTRRNHPSNGGLTTTYDAVPIAA